MPLKTLLCSWNLPRVKDQRPLRGVVSIRVGLVTSLLAAVVFAILYNGVFLCTRFLDASVAAMLDGNSLQESNLTTKTVGNYSSDVTKIHQNPPTKTKDFPLNCPQRRTQNRTCPVNYHPSEPLAVDEDLSSAPSPSCPEYFRWIYEDLWPWSTTGITREIVMSANPKANFRLVIVNGKAYVQKYRMAFQTRDVFTLWGILQLLRRYPGRVPDLELMFNCDDRPVIGRKEFGGQKHQPPPPLFRYCGDDDSFNILFPDWSFWGWPEINIKPWETLAKDLKEGNMRSNWIDREPHAYWKGNTYVSLARFHLLACNVSKGKEWNARIYSQDWLKEQREGYKQSDLARQCVHRYKIYIEGRTWSVSEKYIMACDSVTLVIKPNFYDFFTRSLVPLKHYWPIKSDDKCRSIKHAVDWGNNHQQEAQAIGKAGSRFILDELKMDYVYDYMFHVLSEYAKLLKYKPTVPPEAVEFCSESMSCHARGLEKEFMADSLVKGPALSNPCTMPPPYGPASLHSVIQRKNGGIKQVQTWEEEYWGKRNKRV